MLSFIYFFKLSSAASWQSLPGQHKLCYLLSLAPRYQRIWKGRDKIHLERERRSRLPKAGAVTKIKQRFAFVSSKANPLLRRALKTMLSLKTTTE